MNTDISRLAISALDTSKKKNEDDVFKIEVILELSEANNEVNCLTQNHVLRQLTL